MRVRPASIFENPRHDPNQDSVFVLNIKVLKLQRVLDQIQDTSLYQDLLLLGGALWLLHHLLLVALDAHDVLLLRRSHLLGQFDHVVYYYHAGIVCA